MLVREAFTLRCRVIRFRLDRVIAELDRAWNSSEYRCHGSRRVPSRLDSLAAQDVDHASWLAEVAPFASVNRKYGEIDRTPAEYVTREVRITYGSVELLDIALL